MAEFKNEPLKLEALEITGLELVEKEGKNGNKWKEYKVKVKDYTKGVSYSFPVKKKDDTFTKVYELYKEKKSDWEELFEEDNTVKVKVGVSEFKWEFDGKSGTKKTIRFMEELSEVDEALLAKKEEDKEISVEDIAF